MNLTQEEFDAWIDLLQHGRHTQTERFLYEGGGYCCMGVCGLVLGIHEERMYKLPLLTSVAGADNLRDRAARVFDHRESNVLATLNDYLHLTFPQIAAFVLAGALDAYETGIDGTLMERTLG